jgi:integrase
MPFRKSGSPFWHFDFRVGGYRFSGSTKCRDEHHAAETEAEKRREAAELVAQWQREQREPLKLRAACSRWWNEHGQHLTSPNDKMVLDRICEIIGGAVFLHAIEDNHVSRLVAERRKDMRRDSTTGDGKPVFRLVSPATVNSTVSLLRRVIRRARDNWNVAIIREPVWRKHFLETEDRPVREILPSEETRLDQEEGADFAELRRFAIVTGLRRRNLLLTWHQVNFELGQITVIAKGGKPRTIPMTREVYAMLWRRREHDPVFVWTAPAERTFVNPKTGEKRIRGQRYPITYYGLGSHMRRAWKRAGVNARIHDMRHTTGMRTLRKTGNLKLVQKLLGHTDIATTARFYTDATLEDLRAGMEAASSPAPAELEPIKQIEKKGGNE